MYDYKKLASILASKKADDEKWLAYFAKKNGKTVEDIIAERKRNLIHDDKAELVCSFDGYELSVCETKTNEIHDDRSSTGKRILIGSPKKVWRYTVWMPWGVTEGLCDLEERDDDGIRHYLESVIAEIGSIDDTYDQKPIKAKKTPSAGAAGIRAASDEPARATVKAETPSKAERRPVETKTDATERPRTRSKGRPKGSRDSKPRRRRTKAEMAADRANETQNVGIDLANGPVPADNDAWIPDNDGRYRRYDVWYGGSWLQVRIDGKLVDLPANAVLSEKNVRPAVLSTFETRNRARRTTVSSRKWH